MSIFTGAGVALITPMNPDGSINYPEMEHIINDQIAGGTDAVIVCGTTGETATMTYDEHIETIRACVQMTAGRIPVITGTGSNCTKSAVKLSVAAERAGADGLLVVSPYHVAPRDTHDMVIKMLEGDTDGARRLQLKYIPLIHALFCEVNPIPVKAAMNMLGYQAGPLRMPLTEMEEEHQETLREAMRKAGLDVK